MLGFLMATTLAACATDVPDLGSPEPVDHAVTATVLDTQLEPGEVVTVRFVNGGTVDYGFNSCTRSVERRVANAWETLPPELRLCTMELRPLPAGATVTFPVDVPADAVNGTHRFVFGMSGTGGGGGAGISVTSNSFVVGPLSTVRE